MREAAGPISGAPRPNRVQPARLPAQWPGPAGQVLDVGQPGGRSGRSFVADLVPSQHAMDEPSFAMWTAFRPLAYGQAGGFSNRDKGGREQNAPSVSSTKGGPLSSTAQTVATARAASPQAFELVTVTQRPPPALPVDQAEQLVEDDADED